MQATSWIDKIADESNLWLTAVKAEESGQLQWAAVLYLRDAQGARASKKPVKAALSSNCAATCLANLGLHARAQELYAESARLYLEHGEAAAGTSVREYLWCLREAYRAYQQADLREKAEDVRRRYVSLAGRIDPFIFVDALPTSETITSEEPQKEPVTEDPAITVEINRFLHHMGETPRGAGRGKNARPSEGRRPDSLENRITNQLG
jgi:hypothetical protein